MASAAELRKKYNIPDPKDIRTTTSESLSIGPVPAGIFKAAPAIKTGSFASNVKEEVVQKAAPVARAVGAFAKDQASLLDPRKNTEVKVKPSDVWEGIKRVSKGLGKATKVVAEGFNEGVIRFAKSGVELNIGKERTRSIGESIPLLKDFEEAVTGRDKIDTFQRVYEKSQEFAYKNNATKEEATIFAGVAVIGLGLMDNPLFGPGKSAKVFSLTDQAAKAIAEAETREATKAALTVEFKGMGDDQLEALTDVFTPVRDTAAVREIESQIAQSMRGFRQVRDTDTDDVEIIPTEEESMEQVARQASGREVDEISSTAARNEPQSDLLVEARKYESAEEFVQRSPQVRLADEQEPIFYHGTTKENAEAIRRGGFNTDEVALTPDRAEALEYGDEIIEVRVKEGAREVRPDSREPLYSPEDARILDPENPATRSQLTDIWKRANQGLPEVDLMDEARKYKSAEEFSKAYQNKYLKVENIDPETIKLSDDFTAQTAAERSKRFSDVENAKPILFRIDDTGAFQIVDGNARLTAFKEQGKRIPLAGIDIKNSSKAQVIDIWKRATNAAPESSPVAPAAFSPNLLRKISESDLAGPILDELKQQFPKISERTLTRFANRFTRQRSTASITRSLEQIKRLSDALDEAGTPEKLMKILDEKNKDVLPINLKGKDAKALSTVEDVTLKLMTKQERDTYVRTVTEVLKDREHAILAQREYDMLWEHVGEKVFERYENLQVLREILDDELSRNNAKKLLKFYGPRNASDYTLAEIMRTAKPGQKAAGLDDVVTELGYADLDAAQEGLEAYLKMRDERKAIAEEMRELRPQLQAARILRPMLDDIPVILRETAGEIDMLADAGRVEKVYKDISGLNSQFRDLWRNFDAFFGKYYEDAKKAILDPFDDAKGQMVDDMNALATDLEKKIVKDLGIKRGSELDEAIQRYGDTGLIEGERYTAEMLVDKFGRENAEKVIEADKWFRSSYNRMIGEVNDVLAKIYPNDPTKLIPKRSDYYRHFSEMGEGFQGLYDILLDVPAGIDPMLAGMSARTKPKQKFIGFSLPRVGKGTEISAINGFIDYSASFVYAKHINPHIGNFRYLRRRLAETAERPGTRDIDFNKIEGINVFLEYLDDVANQLAGKTNPADRWLQKVVPGGRKTFRLMNWVNNRIKANTIAATASGSLAQILNLPRGIGAVKLHGIEGAKRMYASIWQPVPEYAQSTFLKERYARTLGERFKTDWSKSRMNKIRRAGEEARAFGRFTVTALDEVSTRFIWNSFYAKAIAEQIKDPVRYADAEARRIVAGRGVGEMALVQKSETFRLVSPFMVEVVNEWYSYGDFIKRKDFAGLVTALAAGWAINELLENTRGSRGSFDPINSIHEGSIIAAEEAEEGNYGRASLKFLGRQAGEILSNIPFGQQFTMMVPEKTVMNVTGMERRELFGQGDPTRFGGTMLLVTGTSDPLYRLALPVGGLQVKRTLEGVQSMLSGQVDTAGGKLNFEVNATPLNVIRAVLFGKYATPEARKTFEENDTLFNRIYIQDNARTDLRMRAEEIVSEVEKLETREEKLERLYEVDEEDPKLGNAIKEVLKDRKMGLDSTDRLIKMLGVANGERAKYIVEELNDMKSPEEKRAFLENLSTKKLLSSEVLAQVRFLMGREGN